MKPECWQKVKEIFNKAADMEPAARKSFVAKASDGDEEVYVEVMSLLDSYQDSDKFLQPSRPLPCTIIDKTNLSTLSCGQMLGGRFRVLRFIGQGGMGEVYEAYDEWLNDRIAIKIIRPEASTEANVARFHQEVQLAHLVTHPNICRIFDLEQHACPELGRNIVYLTMEFLEGETLRDRLKRVCPLPTGEALAIIRQVAAGLAASHAAEVIHRDLKPSNVILAGHEPGALRAVVTDFGIARVARNNHSALTHPNEVVGTFDYMAPEQIEKRQITPAADIYSLGLIMYEMFTGKKPFQEDNGSGLARRTKHSPISPRTYLKEMDAGVESLILACLAVDPGQRIEASIIVRMVDEFRAAPGDKPSFMIHRDSWFQSSIAVLPFTNLGPHVEGDYFGDGLAEELIGTLNRIEGLRVLARSSTFRYRGSQIDVREVVRELNVDLVVEGAVRRSKDRLRVTVSLVSAAEGDLLWSDRYDRGMEDLFAIQEEIANSIASQLQMKVRAGQGPHFVQHRTQNIEAYNHFLKGRFFSNKRTPRNLKKAREHFTLSLEEDPHFAPALAGLADCCVIQGVYGTHPPQEVFSVAKEKVFEALTLNPHMAEAHCFAGCIQAVYDWKWKSAEVSFQRALELDPKHATTHHSYALYCLLPQGLFLKARSHLNLALDHDPLSLAINASVAVCSYFERRYDHAIRKCKEILDLDPNFGMAHFFLGQSYAQKGLYPEAVAAFEQAVILTERSAESLAWLGRTWALAGKPAKARALLKKLQSLARAKYVSPVLFAGILLALNETEAAVDHLQRACALRSADLVWIGVRPIFDRLRSESRFQKICKTVGLP